MKLDKVLNILSKNPHTSNFLKIRPVGAELLHEDVQTDRHDKPIVAVSNFANAPKNDQISEYMRNWAQSTITD
jgi:hypothetical protein